MSLTLYRVTDYRRALRFYNDGSPDRLSYPEYVRILEQSPALEFNVQESVVWEALLKEARVFVCYERWPNPQKPTHIDGCQIDRIVRRGRSIIRLRKKEGLDVSTHQRIVVFLWGAIKNQDDFPDNHGIIIIE